MKTLLRLVLLPPLLLFMFAGFAVGLVVMSLWIGGQTSAQLIKWVAQKDGTDPRRPAAAKEEVLK